MVHRSAYALSILIGILTVPLVTMETSGSNCFYQSIALNRGPFSDSPRTPPENVQVVHNAEHNVNVAHLSKISSLATSLGASVPAPAVVKMALERPGGVKSVHVSDALAMEACLRFAGTSIFRPCATRI